jgi:predicted MFS family arabinose efflux permease
VGTFWVLLNLYLRALGLSDGEIGRVLSAQALGTVLAAVPASLIASRVRLKRLLVGATLVGGAAFTLLVTLRSFPLLLAAATAAGAAFVVHSVLAAPFFMRNSSPAERLHLFGMNYSVEILTSVAGVAGGGWLAHHLAATLGSELLGLRFTLLASTLLLVGAVVPYLLIHSPPPPSADLRHRGWAIRRPRLLLKLMTPAFLVGCGAGLIIPFLNLYFRDRFSLGTDAIGAVFAVSQGLTALGFAVGPVLARRFGRIRTVVGAELASIPFFVALAFTHRLEVAVVAFWLRGTLMNMNHPIARNFAMESVDPTEHEFTNASLETTWNFSWMITAQVGGWLIERHGFTLPMMITVGLYLVSSSLYLAFFHDHERRFFPAPSAAGAPPAGGTP